MLILNFINAKPGQNCADDVSAVHLTKSLGMIKKRTGVRAVHCFAALDKTLGGPQLRKPRSKTTKSEQSLLIRGNSCLIVLFSDVGYFIQRHALKSMTRKLKWNNPASRPASQCRYLKRKTRCCVTKRKTDRPWRLHFSNCENQTFTWCNHVWAAWKPTPVWLHRDTTRASGFLQFGDISTQSGKTTLLPGDGSKPR